MVVVVSLIPAHTHRSLTRRNRAANGWYVVQSGHTVETGAPLQIGAGIAARALPACRSPEINATCFGSAG
jgi:hypothetical protein